MSAAAPITNLQQDAAPSAAAAAAAWAQALVRRQVHVVGRLAELGKAAARSLWGDRSTPPEPGERADERPDEPNWLLGAWDRITRGLKLAALLQARLAGRLQRLRRAAWRASAAARDAQIDALMAQIARVAAEWDTFLQAAPNAPGRGGGEDKDEAEADDDIHDEHELDAEDLDEDLDDDLDDELEDEEERLDSLDRLDLLDDLRPRAARERKPRPAPEREPADPLQLYVNSHAVGTVIAEICACLGVGPGWIDSAEEDWALAEIEADGPDAWWAMHLVRGLTPPGLKPPRPISVRAMAAPALLPQPP